LDRVIVNRVHLSPRASSHSGVNTGGDVVGDERDPEGTPHHPTLR